MSHAEIAGGGIAGLALGTLLARQGWTVQIHERNEGIREVGAGIYLRNNPLRVLEHLGIDEGLLARSLRLRLSEWRDGRGRLFHRQELEGDGRLWMCPRQDLIQALEKAARDAGVEIRLGSHIVGAEESGVLVNSHGERFEAALAVGADGHTSPVRESLGLTGIHEKLPTLATRFLVPNRRHEPEDRTTMFWSGHRRVGVSACGVDKTYVYLISTEQDVSGRRVPIDVASWSESFPVLTDLFDELATEECIQHNYHVVRCPKWSRGQVALVGDSAHGLTPLLGQGAGLAISNAYALGRTLGSSPGSIPERLASWESTYRSYADVTQSWSSLLDKMTNHWPEALLFARGRALWAITNIPLVRRSMRKADRFPIAT